MVQLDHAVDYAARGWPVCPLHSVKDGKCSCGNPDCKSPGKHPRTKNGIKEATIDVAQVRAWWTRWPDASIALACGKQAGVFVIDVDTKEGQKGEESLESLTKAIGNGGLPMTREARTGSGGRHLFFKYPEGRAVKNKQPIDKHLYPDLDVRGDGGYVVLPPSVHHTGRTYSWVSEIELADCPTAALDVIAPQKKAIPPWEQKPAAPAPPSRPCGTPVLDRAAKYLEECEPATQGTGGHNALLWAARAMVVGFELSDADAINLLWSVFNPRCNPPWDRSSAADVKDFERKVEEARRTPGEKPRGWCLDEFGLRSDTDAMASIIGGAFAASYQERMYQKAGEDYHEPVVTADTPPVAPPEDSFTVEPFPLHCFPPKVREYIELVADVQVVDPAGVALSVLVSAGSCIGNTCRFRLKGGFDVPPILWGAVISRSGSNKSGPFRELIKPMRAGVPLERIHHRIRNPQGQLLIEDATTESVLDVMASSPRGLIMANGEGAGWIGAFDRYSQGSKKKVSVDETIWLKLWDGDTYQKNRKTDSENTLIHNASCGVLVCIQPKKMAECFDPGQFASGLVPRLLVVYLPKAYRGWSEREMTDLDVRWWRETTMKLRLIPFADQDPNTGEFFPNIILPSMAAKERYVTEFNRIARDIEKADEMTELFLGKAQGMTGRVALVLHGMGFACGEHDMMTELTEQTMSNGIEIMQYCVRQQLAIYNLAGESFAKQRVAEMVGIIKAKDGSISPRDLQRVNNRKWPSSDIATRDLVHLAQAGMGTWNAATKRFTLT